MKVVIQRVSEASVTINEEQVAAIKHGLVVFVGIVDDDTQLDIDWLCKKIINLRIFADENNSMNTSIVDAKGDIILVSQFTLHASTKKGNRPSFIKAAKPNIARPLYNQFIEKLQLEFGRPIQTGQFGADMQVKLVNDGPVTLIIDSKEKL